MPMIRPVLIVIPTLVEEFKLSFALRFLRWWERQRNRVRDAVRR